MKRMQLDLHYYKQANRDWGCLKFIGDSQLSFNLNNIPQEYIEWKKYIMNHLKWKNNILIYSYTLNHFTSKDYILNHMKKEA